MVKETKAQQLNTATPRTGLADRHGRDICPGDIVTLEVKASTKPVLGPMMGQETWAGENTVTGEVVWEDFKEGSGGTWVINSGWRPSLSSYSEITVIKYAGTKEPPEYKGSHKAKLAFICRKCGWPWTDCHCRKDSFTVIRKPQSKQPWPWYLYQRKTDRLIKPIKLKKPLEPSPAELNPIPDAESPPFSWCCGSPASFSGYRVQISRKRDSGTDTSTIILQDKEAVERVTKKTNGVSLKMGFPRPIYRCKKCNRMGCASPNWRDGTQGAYFNLNTITKECEECGFDARRCICWKVSSLSWITKNNISSWRWSKPTPPKTIYISEDANVRDFAEAVDRRVKYITDKIKTLGEALTENQQLDEDIIHALAKKLGYRVIIGPGEDEEHENKVAEADEEDSPDFYKLILDMVGEEDNREPSVRLLIQYPCQFGYYPKMTWVIPTIGNAAYHVNVKGIKSWEAPLFDIQARFIKPSYEYPKTARARFNEMAVVIKNLREYRFKNIASGRDLTAFSLILEGRPAKSGIKQERCKTKEIKGALDYLWDEIRRQQRVPRKIKKCLNHIKRELLTLSSMLEGEPDKPGVKLERHQIEEIKEALDYLSDELKEQQHDPQKNIPCMRDIRPPEIYLRAELEYWMAYKDLVAKKDAPKFDEIRITPRARNIIKVNFSKEQKAKIDSPGFDDYIAECNVKLKARGPQSIEGFDIDEIIKRARPSTRDLDTGEELRAISEIFILFKHVFRCMWCEHTALIKCERKDESLIPGLGFDCPYFKKIKGLGKAEDVDIMGILAAMAFINFDSEGNASDFLVGMTDLIRVGISLNVSVRNRLFPCDPASGRSIGVKEIFNHFFYGKWSPEDKNLIESTFIKPCLTKEKIHTPTHLSAAELAEELEDIAWMEFFEIVSDYLAKDTNENRVEQILTYGLYSYIVGGGHEKETKQSLLQRLHDYIDFPARDRRHEPVNIIMTTDAGEGDDGPASKMAGAGFVSVELASVAGLDIASKTATDVKIEYYYPKDFKKGGKYFQKTTLEEKIAERDEKDSKREIKKSKRPCYIYRPTEEKAIASVVGKQLLADIESPLSDQQRQLLRLKISKIKIKNTEIAAVLDKHPSRTLRAWKDLRPEISSRKKTFHSHLCPKRYEMPRPDGPNCCRVGYYRNACQCRERICESLDV